MKIENVKKYDTAPVPSFSLEVLRRVAANASLIGSDDVADITRQLDRYPRGLVGIGARCACGQPAVTITYPRLGDGSPFPTLFYLSLPWLVREISRIESSGGMEPFNERLREGSEAYSPELAENHRAAHRSYVERRALLAQVPEIAQRSAGGMPDRVKCLHALAGYALAVGPGACRVGDEALALAHWDQAVCRCGSA
ncbi:MAG: DUF501 domain-containing protein [Actinomycetaceae bacterium]|nr:DUF501 domain-containing protein [Actinomycetaceae bacterium]MDY5854325.1 DUF501 domain-containing protein [Arcanobacterium sp.]